MAESSTRDTLLIVLATLVFCFMATALELNETLSAWTRPWEAYQLDELPGVLLFLVTALAWFGWRRHGEARAELWRRRDVEHGLEQALAENRRLMQNNVRIQEEERRVLARELHDEMGQSLNAIKVEAFNALKGNASCMPEALRSIIALTDRLHGLVRDRLRTLRPAGLDELGLDAAIEECVAGWQARLPQGMISLDIEGSLDGIGEEINVAVFRLVQEGLSNAVRHAQANRIEIVLGQRDSPRNELLLTIVDDGIGLPGSRMGNGLGLAGMRERVLALGGSLDIGNGKIGGTTLAARIPLAGLIEETRD